MSSLGCSGHEMGEFRISRRVNTVSSLQSTALSSRRAGTGLFSDQLGGIPWDTVWGRTGVQETQLTVTDHALQAQEESISTFWKPSSGGGGPAQMSKELLTYLRH